MTPPDTEKADLVKPVPEHLHTPRNGGLTPCRAGPLEGSVIQLTLIGAASFFCHHHLMTPGLEPLVQLLSSEYRLPGPCQATYPFQSATLSALPT